MQIMGSTSMWKAVVTLYLEALRDGDRAGAYYYGWLLRDQKEGEV